MAVTGVPETLAAFDAFDRELGRAARAVTSAVVERVKSRAKALCPYSSPKAGPFPGHLRDQIMSQMSPDSPSGAVFVERVGIGGYFGTDNRGIWLEYGTRTRRAHPFMGPASEVERGNYLRELQDVTERATKRFR